MVESRGNWSDLIKGVGLEIADVFDQGQDLYMPGIGNILSISSGDGAQVNFTGKTGVDRLDQFKEGDNVPKTKRYKSYTTKVVYNDYGNGVIVTRNNMEDRDFQAQLDEMMDLSRAANQSMDESGTQLYNGGFDTVRKVNGYTLTFYGDGVPTYSTIHPSNVPGQSSQSNASSTGIPFGHDALEIGKLNIVRQQTDNGRPTSYVGKHQLVLPPELEKEAIEVVDSDLISENANNAISVHKGRYDIAVSTFMDATREAGSDTAWFLRVQGRDRQFHETRRAASMDTHVDPNSKNVTFDVTARWADYVKDWRGKFASKGDQQAYSN